MEWDDFYALFYLPFKDCDIDDNYILNQEEAFNCLTNTTGLIIDN